MTMTDAQSTERSRAEAERQLAAAVERHREAVAAVEMPGRPEAGQHVAVKVVGRAVQLVSFALRRAADAGIPFERLVELTGWEPDLVHEGLERPVPTPRVVARLAPAELDARAVAQAAATFAAIGRLQALTSRLLAEIDEAESAPLSPADVEDLHARIESAWGEWRRELEQREP